MELPILYLDNDLVVIHKPAGLLVHRSKIDHHETRFAVQLLRDQLGRHVYPVHRLDKPTSGALVFALSPEVARDLVEQFAQGQVRKTYWAVVRGSAPGYERVDYPLRESSGFKSEVAADRLKDAQEAITEIYGLASRELRVAIDRYPTSRYSIVEARPLTGRRHQIRRHLRHLGYPVVGDVTYGVGKHNRFFAETFGVKRLLLAAVEVEFRHPVTLAKIQIRAPLAPDFAQVLVAMGWGGVI